MATAYAYLVALSMPATILLASVNSVNSTHIASHDVFSIRLSVS